MTIQMTRDIIRITLGNAKSRLREHWQRRPDDPGYINASRWLQDMMSLSYRDTPLSDEMIILLDETLGEKSDRS
jgi:hypothetical protein